jgi:hypothetical protein
VPGCYFVEGTADFPSRIYWKRLLSVEGSQDNVSENIQVYKIWHGVQGVLKILFCCTAAIENRNNKQGWYILIRIVSSQDHQPLW